MYYDRVTSSPLWERLHRRGQHNSTSIRPVENLSVLDLSSLLADCAEPAEIMDEPIRQWPTRQVILAPQLPPVRVRVHTSTRRQLLDHVPHDRCRDTRRVALVQMLRNAPEREAGAEHGEDAVGHIGQAPEQPRRPVIAHRCTAAVVVAVVVDDGRRLRLHDGVPVMLDGAV